MPRHPAFSIVINTDNRAGSLAKTLDSLRHLDYSDFEVCVVRGPTLDATSEVLEPWRGKIKLAQCPVRNLAVSRNIGIAMSTGEIVAFIDDDAVPEPEWLRDLAAAYEEPDIDAAGGFVHDQTGVSFQWRYGTCDRLGESQLDWDRATPELNVPGTSSFPALLGTNCSFRRQTLLELGGFDEEYEYYLEETDLCCRLVDRAGKIAQVAGAYVHHQLRPGGERTRRRSLRHWYPTIKNKIYFSLVNGGTQHDMAAIVRAADWFVRFHRGVLEQDIAQGELGEADRARFNADVARAWGDGLTRGLAGDRRLLRPETVRDFAQPFLAFTAPLPVGGRKTFCFLTQHYPPGPMAGVARSVPPLARSIAALGHHTHVLTRGADQDLVDFEDGVWVHRIVPHQTRPQMLREGVFVPQGIWDHAVAILGEVERIATRRPIECVYAPLWDCEGAAIQLDGRFPLAVELHTPMQTVLATQPRLQTDAAYVASIAEPIMALEKRILLSAAGLRSNSNAITQEIEQSYGVSLGERVTLIPHASEDWIACPRVAPADLPPDSLRLLFVGRLEPRKGIDVLLDTASRLLARFPRLHLDIVGSHALPSPDGRTYRACFQAEANAAIRDRVHFHGEVSEEVLRGFYRACDVFVAPSRFESFGLILLEAMMFAKPVVCCRAGGMPEVVVEGETGFLAEPGDAASLERSLERLIEDPALRQRLGAAGRRRYEAHFTPERMASDVAVFLCRTAAAHGAGTASARPRAAAE